jgi:glycerol-3-phosphate dehydrogenase
MKAGAIVPAGGGRTIFVLPWLGQTLIGTTDNDYDGELEHIRPADEDVAGAYAGVRPLISTGDPRKSVDISRKAELYETSSGMVTITGGKLTTWRRMAKLAIDRIVERDGQELPCRTHEVPLGMAVDPAELRRVDGLPDAAYPQLAGRYGHVAHDVLALTGEFPGTILDGMPDLLAEVAHAIRREQARTVGDVLLRRTRLALTAARPLLASDAPERVARVLSAELGLDPGAAAKAFRAEADAEGILPGP